MPYFEQATGGQCSTLGVKQAPSSVTGSGPSAEEGVGSGSQGEVTSHRHGIGSPTEVECLAVDRAVDSRTSELRCLKGKVE